MKNRFFLFTFIFTFSTALISCRDTADANIDDVDLNEEQVEIEIEEEGDIESAVEEGVNEAAENTGLGGNDDL